MENLNDIELIEIIAGSSSLTDKAFSELYRRYSKIIYSFCNCMVQDKDLADDIFQDTFIRFYKSCRTGTKIINTKAFIITIARNLVKNTFRISKDGTDFNIDTMDLIDENSNYDNVETMDMIMKSLDMIDEKYKEAFIFREFYNLSFEEISELTTITVSGVKSRVKRAKLKLAEILQPYIKDIY